MEISPLLQDAALADGEWGKCINTKGSKDTKEERRVEALHSYDFLYGRSFLWPEATSLEIPAPLMADRELFLKTNEEQFDPEERRGTKGPWRKNHKNPP
jgi:hypothetical protein